MVRMVENNTNRAMINDAIGSLLHRRPDEQKMMTFPKAKNIDKDGTIRAGNYLLPKLRIED